MKFTTTIATTAVFASAKSSCINDDAATRDDVYKGCNIMQFAETKYIGSDISTLVAAVVAGDLADTLTSPGPFTIFAPLNDAFEELPAGFVDNLLKPENKAALVSLLNYHVLPKQVRSEDWKPTQVVKTVEGKTLHVVVDATGKTCPQQPGSKETIICVSVGPSLKDLKKQTQTSEFLLSNAAMYLIDGVLMPPAPAMPTKREQLASIANDSKIYAIGGNVGPGRNTNTVEILHGLSWTSGAAMPTKRDGLAAAMLGGKIYAIGGGDDGDNQLNTVEIFDGTSWTAGPSMPTRRDFLAAAVLDGKIYAIGGGWNDTLNTVEVFDGTSWTAGPAMPTKRTGLATAVLGGKIYAIGGWDDGGNQLNTVEVFDGTSWTAGPAMPTHLQYWGVATAVLGGKIYAFSGWDDGLNSVKIFDGTSWTAGPSMPTWQDGLAAAVLGGKIYAIGGSLYEDPTKLNTVEVFDGTSWTAGPSMPTRRDGLATAVLGGKIYAIGGMDDGHNRCNTVEVFDGAVWSPEYRHPSRNGDDILV